MARPGEIFVLDFARCEAPSRGQPEFKTCSGQFTVLNTGFDAWVAGDGGRDLARWHGVSAFQGTSLTVPTEVSAERPMAGEKWLALSCWAIWP